MNTSTTTINTNALTTHHGLQSKHSGNGEMEIEPRIPSAKPAADPDIMDTSIDSSLATQNAHTIAAAPRPTSNSSEAPLQPTMPASQNDVTGDFVPLRLSRRACVSQRPHPSQDLITLYHLSPLAATVARNDPITGEKVNKMRKSYEGQVKTFGLAGRNKAVKQEEGTAGGLMELVSWPDEEWQNQKTTGKELEKGLPGLILGKLEKAMRMEPGPVPKNDEWESILGLEKLKPPIRSTSKPRQTNSETAPKAPKVPGYTNGIAPGTPTTAEGARPKRASKKRNYHETSFEGYGEGYVDDDGDMGDAGGYSSGDGSRKSSMSKKKRKKDYVNPNPPAMPDRSGSYGVGMMHVGTGIGAFGR